MKCQTTLRSACTKGGHYSLEGTFFTGEGLYSLVYNVQGVNNVGGEHYSQGVIIHSHNTSCKATRQITDYKESKNICRELLSWSFWTPRSENSQNAKLLPTSERLWHNLIWHLKHKKFLLPVGKLGSTHHPFTKPMASHSGLFSSSAWISLPHTTFNCLASLVTITAIHDVTHMK